MIENLLNELSGLIVWKYRLVIIKGLTVTMQVTLISMLISLIVALIVAFARLSKNRILKAFAVTYIEIGRDTPILVTLLWSTYVLPPMLGIRIPPYWTAILALVVQTSGYLAETFRSAVESIDTGQMIAAKALGMDYFLAMRRIILPQAFRRAIHDVVNNFVVLFKTSTLVSIVAVPDLMYQASRLVGQLFRPVEIYSSVAVVYLVIVFFLSSIIRFLEQKLRQRERAEI